MSPPPRSSCRITALAFAFALAAPACSSTSDSPSVDAPACAAPGTIVLAGSVDGKDVSQTLPTSSYVLDQLSDPKSVKAGFGTGALTLNWPTLLANGATTELTLGTLRLPDETTDRKAESGAVALGNDQTRASLTFATGKVGVCLNTARH
jgi:hypothetical protein